MLCLVDAESDRGSISKKNCISDDNDDLDDGLFVTTCSGRVAGTWRFSFNIVDSRKR